MKAVKWFSVFCFSLMLGVYPHMTYGQEQVDKAPQEDSHLIELNDPKTIVELERITKGEFGPYINGRSPLSVDLPQIDKDKYLEIFNSSRVPKDDAFRAPAIKNPESFTISQ